MRKLLAVGTLLGSFGFAQETSAGPCSVTVAGSTCSVAFGTTSAVYTNVLPTGTFYVDPFLQMKNTGGSTTEQGYNTTGTFQLQTQGDTGALTLGAVPIVTIGGVQYREFLLAVNEPG